MLFYVALLAVSIIAAVFSFFHYKFQYWKRLDVPHLPPVFPYGHRQKGSRQTGFLIQNHYEQFKQTRWPFFGMYFMQRAIVIPTSLDLVKSVLVKHFQICSDRGVYYNEESDPLSAHLFAINGKKWRTLRHKLTPTFTSGKMKFMYPTMIEVATRFEQCLSNIICGDRTESVELKELLARFTTDIIGTCAFGIECNSLADPNAKFRQMGKSILTTPRHASWATAMIGSFQGLARMLGVKVFQDDVSEFFINVVRDTVKYREANNVRRNDFLDLLIDLKNQDSLNLDEIAAQCFIFFIAGFETSSTNMMYTLYELAINPDIQSKLRNDIKAILSKHNGQFTYEAMMDMHYMDQVINESLRKYPPITALLRNATEPFPVPEMNLVLPSGTQFFIPVYAIHHDADYYPNPQKFDPERFTAEAVAERDKCAFLPFGDGPRNCIGLRFGMMQTRVGLVSLLLNYEFSRSDRTLIPLAYDKKSFVLTPEGGMWLNMKKI